MGFFKNQKGQTLPSVVLIMIVALGIGVTVSTRYFRTVRQSTRLDASHRALAVAESLVERLLSTDYQTLMDYINFNNCGSACTLEIVGDDGVTANAAAILSQAGGSSDPFEVNLSTDNVVEVSLDSYPDSTTLKVCWNAPPSGDLPSITASLLKGTDGNYSLDSYAYNPIGSLYSANGFLEATAELGYSNCFDIDSSADPYAVRLRSIYNDSIAYVLVTGGATLPSQGILITSTGIVSDSERKVEVLFSSPFMPLPFDYVLYNKSTEYPLSN